MKMQQVSFTAADGKESNEVTVYFMEKEGIKNVVGYTTNVEPYFLVTTPYGRSIEFNGDIAIDIDIELNEQGVAYVDQNGQRKQTEFKSFEDLNNDMEFGKPFAMHCMCKVWGIEYTLTPDFPGWEHVINHLTQIGLSEDKLAVIKQAAKKAGYQA